MTHAVPDRSSGLAKAVKELLKNLIRAHGIVIAVLAQVFPFFSRVEELLVPGLLKMLERPRQVASLFGLRSNQLANLGLSPGYVPEVIPEIEPELPVIPQPPVMPSPVILPAARPAVQAPIQPIFLPAARPAVQAPAPIQQVYVIPAGYRLVPIEPGTP